MKRRNDTRLSSPVRFGSRWTTWTDRQPTHRDGRIWRLSLHESDTIARVRRRNRRTRIYHVSGASYVRVYRAILNGMSA